MPHVTTRPRPRGHTASSVASNRFLTKRQIVSALTVTTWPALVGEVYGAALRTIDDEIGRQSRLDAKATALLSGAGLSVTVALSTMGYLLSRPVAGWYFWASLAAFVLAAAAGLGAAGCSLRALFVHGGHKRLGMAAILHEATLRGANGESSGDLAVAAYQKALASELWTIVKVYDVNLEAKATWVKWGQLSFGAFMVSVFVAVTSFVAGVVAK